MAKIDFKIEAWERVIIDDSDLDELLKLMKENKVCSSDEVIDLFPDATYEGVIYEAQTQLQPYENDNQPTVEIYKNLRDIEPIWTNESLTESNDIKYLLIKFEVQDGERAHQYKILHTTYCKNIEFAVLRYLFSFWGEGEHDGRFIWFNWEFGINVDGAEYNVLTKEEYDMLSKYI
jgi:hypothetical protein